MRFALCVLCVFIVVTSNSFAQQKGIYSDRISQDGISIGKLKSDQHLINRGIFSGSKPFAGLFGNREKPEVVVIDGGDGDDNEKCGDDRSVPYAFRRYKIVPELVEDPPVGYLTVEYADIDGCQPTLGNRIDVCSVIQAPTYLKWRCNRDKLYTIFFIDVYPLGLRNPKLLSQGILWWVVDIPGCNFANGKTLFEYQQPLPLYGSGIDRYVFLVYEQPDYTIDWSEEPLVSATSEKFRYYRCVDKLANKYQLQLVAGNFFTSEYQPCVQDGLNGLDSPSPMYIDEAANLAHLPPDPNAA